MSTKLKNGQSHYKSKAKVVTIIKFQLLTLVKTSDRLNDAAFEKHGKDKTSEAARFAYVASSRPKYILVWCVKNLKPKEKIELESLGFEVLSC